MDETLGESGRDRPMRKIRFSLRGKLIVAFTLVVFAAASIPTIYELSYLLKHIYSEAEHRMSSDVEIASLVFNKHEDLLLRISRSLSRDMWIGKIVAYNSDPRTKVRMVRERARGFLRGYSEADLTFMTITDSSGATLFRSENELSGQEVLRTKDPFIKRALDGNESVGYRVVNARELWEEGLLRDMPGPTDTQSGLLLEAAAPIIATGEMDSLLGGDQGFGRQSSVVGAIVTGYWLNRDHSILREIKERTRGAAGIYTRTGLVNSTEHDWISRLPAGIFSGNSQPGRKVVTFAKRGEICGYMPLVGPDGMAVALFELRTSTISIGRAWRTGLVNTLLFTAVGILITSVIGFLLTRRITGRINALLNGAEEIGKGNLSYRIAVQGNDEMTDLAEGFNVMSIRLQRTIEEMRLGKRQIEEYSARLKSAHASLEMYSQELEKVNQQLLDSNVRLQRANEVKDTFLSTVSHELKTPLTTIIGYVSMMLEGALGSLPEEQRQAMEIVNRRGRNLQDLIMDLLDLSRLDSGRLELRSRYIDIAQEIRNIEEVFRERLKANGQQMLISIPDNLPRVQADSERLSQVLSNLIGNAIKFTPPGGAITVRAARPPDASHIIVSVSDTGIGMPHAELSHIFDRFYQVDRRDGREFPGTGLGLAISKEIVELHGGRIWAESREGTGSTFFFTLPL